MPRTLWKGTLSFGLVSIPVALYTATEDKSPSFNQLRASDHSRISYQRVAKADGEPVEYDDIVKGYEYARDHYVVFDREELDGLRPSSSRLIEIEQFVPLEQIDPIYFNRSYYLAPEPAGAKAYGLLSQAMTDEGTVAICRITMRDKEHPATLRLRDGVFVLETMHWPDEIRSFALTDVDVDELPEPRPNEVAMAKQLIASLTEDFDPSAYVDTYRERVLEAVEAKVEGNEISVPQEEEEPAAVVDLMAALQASVEQAGQRRSSQAS
ncbi:MAG: Ku protein [Egibacteraceae bacterium]